jgi:hypothetical protein
MMDTGRKINKRAMTGMCSMGCIMLLLNKEVFDIIGKDKANTEKVDIAQSIYKNIPGIQNQYVFSKVFRYAPQMFKEEKWI